MKKESILKFVFALSGLACFFIFCATKNDALMHRFAKRNPDYGDLYNLSRVSRFNDKPPAEMMPAGANAAVNDAGLIVIGDCFAFVAFGQNPVYELLADRIGQPYYFSKYDNPYTVLRKAGIRKKEPRPLVLLVAERTLVSRFGSPLAPIVEAAAPGTRRARLLPNRLHAAFDLVFKDTRNRHRYFIINFPPTAFLYNAVMDLRFRLLQRIAPETALFSLTPPMLFHQEEIDDFRRGHTDAQIKAVAANLAALGADLKTKWNLELLLMPVPNKITLYHRMADPATVYDRFLPRLYEALDGLDVKTIKLFDEFYRHKEGLLYYASDTRWNAKGIAIGLDKADKALRFMGPSQQ